MESIKQGEDRNACETHPRVPDVVMGPSFKRLAASIMMQAVVLSFLYSRFQESGILDIMGGYVVAYNPFISPKGLISSKEFILLSDRVVVPYGMYPGYVHVRGKMIGSVGVGLQNETRHEVAKGIIASRSKIRVLDYGAHVIGPGLVDTHIHMNEPGRENWEGIESATRAAAAGGVTTVIDMPLNSHPCTTTSARMKNKIKIAGQRGKAMVDVGFWGGLVPENCRRPRFLRSIAEAGALGFKAFMSPSGINDFPNVSPDELEFSLKAINELGLPLLVHAELIEQDDECKAEKHVPDSNYKAWLDSRPNTFEQKAVRSLIESVKKLKKHLIWEKSNAGQSTRKVFNDGFRVHIVHVADAETIGLIHSAKAEGLPITAEVCPHYLLFSAEDVAEGDTKFKCAPPLRDSGNRRSLLKALSNGWYDSVGSDHSPSPPEMKALESGNFTAAWGGISGLQYSLPGTWHIMSEMNLSPVFFHALWSKFPAELAGIGTMKGTLSAGRQADIVVWSPESTANTSKDALYHKHKMSPYTDLEIRGKVIATFVRGSLVFSDSVNDGTTSKREMSKEACGKVVRKRRK